MGYDTDADKNIDKTRKHVKKAIIAVSANVINEDWGWDDYTSVGRKKQQKILSLLLEIRGELTSF